MSQTLYNFAVLETNDKRVPASCDNFYRRLVRVQNASHICQEYLQLPEVQDHERI